MLNILYSLDIPFFQFPTGGHEMHSKFTTTEYPVSDAAVICSSIHITGSVLYENLKPFSLSLSLDQKSDFKNQ